MPSSRLLTYRRCVFRLKLNLLHDLFLLIVTTVTTWFLIWRKNGAFLGEGESAVSFEPLDEGGSTADFVLKTPGDGPEAGSEAGAESEIETGAQSGTGAESGIEAETHPVNGAEAQPEGGAEAQPEGGAAQSEGGADAQPEGGAGAQPEGGAGAQPEGGAGAQPEGGAGSSSNSNGLMIPALNVIPSTPVRSRSPVQSGSVCKPLHPFTPSPR
jgi:hypothetical protein